MIVLDKTQLGREPLWQQEPVTTLGTCIKMVIEVVSTKSSFWSIRLSRLASYRLLCSGAIALFIALGLSSKAYSGWGAGWVNDYSGDVIYEMFWIWLVGAWQVHWPVKRIAIAIFLITAVIECTQLIPFPANWQAQLWWRLLLGSSFSWPDFIHYAVGCWLGGISLSGLQNRLGVGQVIKQS
ncbi:MAG: DUF2809 domain-containing protein [Phormidesmis sp.]